MARPTLLLLPLALASCGTSDGASIAPDAGPDAAPVVPDAAPVLPDAGPDAAKSSLGYRCVLDSDCANPLGCVFDFCRQRCPESRECPTGQSCVTTSAGRFCLGGDAPVEPGSSDAAPETAPSIDTAMAPGLPEPACLVNSDCHQPLVCALGTCHVTCLEDRDCPPSQRCETVGAGRICQLPDAGASDGPMSLWGLSRGMNQYRVTAVEQVSDGCALEPAAVVGMSLPVTYDDTTSVISVGTPQGIPPMPSLGAGKVANNMAFLVRGNVMNEGAGCSYRRNDSGVLRLFDHDKFTLHSTEGQSMFSPACTPVPVGGGCVSSWQWTLEKVP
jgi:hypothetical protein